ncbi:SMP-30/gluconolactonase/LRE family protein [Novosphingobium sp. G106]|uniref:SMP-30/gluconolactonase/LRE family protein n=1 Tax=Novosphingobium sp. G106 TaxID=2849500 RepID=UPI001C2D3F8A|nr:SMP-30/gluconolactonase/LRE family protein [Novosphingobium sp. G106]MBV1691171.1 SMP-30/gluconolactonase/LRE family protein [Novosphingobium sp. G106]
MQFEVLATGYCFLEAPRVAGEHVWFTDLLLGGVHRLSPSGKVDTFLPERHHVGGLAVNADGRIICGGPGGLVWLDPATGRSGVLLDTIDGEPFTGANDFIPDGRGGLYMGTLSQGADYSQEPQLTQLYRVDAHLRVTRLSDELKFSNGVGLSPDGKRLYHNESLRGVFVYDVLDDGALANKALFNPREDGDGLAVDAAGGVWIAHFDSAELARYLPDGSLDRSIAMPHKAVSSVAFGGSDRRDIYVTTAGNHGIESLFTGELPPREASLFHARSDIPGVPVAVTRFALPA